jgi:RNA polymerase sigma-70 factor (ECF subfamily)
VSAAAGALERAYRDERAAVLATITRRLDGDLALAEDVVQDAFVAAAVDWVRRGAPDRPGAWLTTAAWRKALERLRHDRVAAAYLPEGPMSAELEYDDSSLEDDQLAMLFACCHPALAPEARMALTLRSVAGLTVPEIARAFLSSEAAMERRLGRARRKVSDARIPVSVPSDELLPERLAGVLRVVYLIYTEGHTATRGAEPVRGDLCEEAIRLTRLLVRLMPAASEARGLLALLLLTDARRAARVDRDGALVALPDQDRSLWDAERIEEGRALIGDTPGPYAIQAMISALHSTAASWAATDWRQIAALYADLRRSDPSPVVAVNRAVALGFADGPHAGLALLDELAGDERLARYQPLHAARAELLARAGEDADEAYARAIELTDNEAERAALGARRMRSSLARPA